MGFAYDGELSVMPMVVLLLMVVMGGSKYAATPHR